MVLTITVELADFYGAYRIGRPSSKQLQQSNFKESRFFVDLYREKTAPDAYFEQRAFPGPTSV